MVEIVLQSGDDPVVREQNLAPLGDDRATAVSSLPFGMNRVKQSSAS